MENLVVSKPIEKRDGRIEEWTPTGLDRCDHAACPSQAYIKATGVTGELMFCAHHYNKIISVAEQKLRAFAFDLQDRRDLLIENRLQGEN